jgi:Na+/proline symporter
MMSLAALLVVLAYFTTQYFAIKWANGLSNPRTSLRRAIYCLSVAASGSSWVYFGSAGYAAKHGLESIALYIGIVLAFTLGFPLLQKIVQLSKAEGIKSISDFIGARYGKSFSVAAVVTVITTIGLIPYISLQITAVHYLIDIYCQSFDQIDLHSEVGVHIVVALVEIGIASYTVFYIAYRPLFKEQYDSLVHGLAFATLVKFVGLFIVGVAAVTFLYGSPFEIFARVISKREQLPMFQAPLSVSNRFHIDWRCLGVTAAQPILHDDCTEPG